MGPVALRHVGSSQTRARTRVPCIGRQILNHCATREAPLCVFVLFGPSTNWMTPAHIGEGGSSLFILLIQISSCNILIKTPRNNALSAIWASICPVRLTHKINHHWFHKARCGRRSSRQAGRDSKSNEMVVSCLRTMSVMEVQRGLWSSDHRRLMSQIREMTSSVAHFTRAWESVKFPYSSVENIPGHILLLSGLGEGESPPK